MDESDRRKQMRDLSEDQSKNNINTLLRRIHDFLQREDSPVGKNKAEKSQETLNWIPSFQSYEDFIQKTLQSLDGFMIIVSTDGIIISVTHDITSLLGHLPDDIVGKTFLSLLPDAEKSGVFSKMAFKTPVSSSVGKHIDFCCHFKRGDAESSNISAYEYVKVILTLKDVSTEPPLLFRSCFSKHTCGSPDVDLPLEDSFYLVGTICVLRAQILWGLFNLSESREVGSLVPNSDEDRSSEDHRSVQEERRCSGMESSEYEITDAEEPVNTIETELSKSSDSTDTFNVNPVVSDAFNSMSLPRVSASPAFSSSETYSLQSFESEPEMGHVTYIHELNHVYKMGNLAESEKSDEEVQENQEDEEDQEEDQEDWGDQEDPEDEENREDQEDKKNPEAEEDSEDEEDPEDKEDQEGQKEQEYQLSSHIISYIKKQEEEMMKKLQKQVDKKTHILQAEIKNQRSSLKTLKEQLQRKHGSKSQELPSIRGHVHRHDLLEPAPKKPCHEAMTSPFSDISDATSVSGSCVPYSSQSTKGLQQTFDTSAQVPIQEEVKYHQQQQQEQQQLQQEEQQQQQQQLQQEQEQQQQQQLLLPPREPQQYNTTGENQVLHVYLPNQPIFSMLCYKDGFTPLPLLQPPPPPPPPPIFLPINLVAEQQPSGYYCAENLNASGYYRAETFHGQEPGRFSFFPENQYQPCMNLFPMTHGSGSHSIYSTNLPQTTTITENPQLVNLETPQDYIHLWQQPQDPQNHLYQVVQQNNWAPNEQATMGQATMGQATYVQVAHIEQGQRSSGLEIVQVFGNNGPNQLNACMSSQQSYLNQ